MDADYRPVPEVAPKTASTPIHPATTPPTPNSGPSTSAARMRTTRSKLAGYGLLTATGV